MPKVYVGDPANSATTGDLQANFSRAGEVGSALSLTNKASGLCRSFGFVEMAERADVARALSMLNNSSLDVRPIEVEADPALKNGDARNRAEQP